MAIGTRATETAKHVLTFDPSLDRDAKGFDYDRFIDTGDPKHIPCKDGDALTVFHLRRLTVRQFEDVFQYADKNEMRMSREAVASGLKDAENWAGPGGRLEFGWVETSNGKRLDEKTLDALYNGGGYELIRELGGRVILLSKLNPTKG